MRLRGESPLGYRRVNLSESATPTKDQAIPLATRFTILLHLSGRHTAEEVAGAMIKAMRQLPADLRGTII